MSEHKFDVGDVVRITTNGIPRAEGLWARVERLEEDWFKDCSEHVYRVNTVELGWLYIKESDLQGVKLEEIQRRCANKPRNGFIVDGLTVNELEAGQEVAYQTFRRAANEARREEARREAEEDRKDRKALAELTVTAILWVVFTLVSLGMWLVVIWTSETVYAPIGYLSALVSAYAVVKPTWALILVCRERIKERRKRKEEQ